MVDRDTGKARTMMDDVTPKTLMPIVRANVAKGATIMTDEHGAYRTIANHFASQGTTTQRLVST